MVILRALSGQGACKFQSNQATRKRLSLCILSQISQGLFYGEEEQEGGGGAYDAQHAGGGSGQGVLDLLGLHSSRRECVC